jgi:hypothetical protein
VSNLDIGHLCSLHARIEADKKVFPSDSLSEALIAIVLAEKLDEPLFD